MKRRPEAKRGIRPLSSALSFDRQVNRRCCRRVDGIVFPTINRLGSREIGWSDHGSTLLVTARCGPARRVVWELRLEAHEIQQPEMAALVKPSQQPGTESCVVNR